MAKKKQTKETIKQEDIVPQIEQNDVNIEHIEVTQEDIENAKPKGLGTIIKAVTNALGIETCDDCEKRKQKLDAMFSYLKRIKRELTQEEIIQVNEWQKTKKVDITLLTNLYNEIYGDKQKPTSCTPCNKQFLEKLIIAIEKQNIK